jgi:hypothetical protein
VCELIGLTADLRATLLIRRCTRTRPLHRNVAPQIELR